jgi:hypothetical protein
VGNYIQRELFETIENAEIEDENLRNAVANIDIRNVLDTSLNVLIGYYKGQRKITRSVRNECRENLIRFLLGLRLNRARLPIERGEGKYARAKSVLLWFLGPLYEAFSRIIGRNLQLMEEGF